MTLPRSDNHTAHATDDYREGWDRIFAGKKHVDCARHKSAEPDMRERCSCPADAPIDTKP